jgi:hypothetical protein
MRPCDVLDLKYWTLMRDTGKRENPDNGYPGTLELPGRFYVRDDGGVAFTASANGVTSKGSKFPRMELHQMRDVYGHRAEWHSVGMHALTASLALDASGLKKRKRLNGIQIHDGRDEVCQVMLHEERGLVLAYDDGHKFVKIDPDYKSGTRCTVRLRSANNSIAVYYNGQKVGSMKARGTTWSWKLGCYLQSNTADYDEPEDATGTVVVWSCVLTGGAA